MCVYKYSRKHGFSWSIWLLTNQPFLTEELSVYIYCCHLGSVRSRKRVKGNDRIAAANHRREKQAISLTPILQHPFSLDVAYCHLSVSFYFNVFYSQFHNLNLAPPPLNLKCHAFVSSHHHCCRLSGIS